MSVRAFLALLAVLLGCGPATAKERRAEQKRAQKSIAAVETAGLVIGEFPLTSKPVVDGDTIHVLGLNSSLRLLGIDTEETFKHESERRAYEAGWEPYLKKMRGDSLHPVKMATPLGMDAKKFAEEFFSGVDTVRLERDHPKQIRDYYDRYLAYVLVQRNGKWVNYNVEAVRAGMSPYFTKYGYSRRFHDDFVKAEQEARAARRGIWDPSREHYPDYDERRKWWDARAEFVKKFEDDAVGNESYMELQDWDTMERLEKHLGKEVTILGAVSDVKLGDKGPTRVTLGRRRGNDFPLIFFDKDVFLSSGVQKHLGEFIRVRGFVNKYEDKYRHKVILQIVVDSPGQIVSSLPESTVFEEEEKKENATTQPAP